mgnify:FL=1
MLAPLAPALPPLVLPRRPHLPLVLTPLPLGIGLAMLKALTSLLAMKALASPLATALPSPPRDSPLRLLPLMFPTLSLAPPPATQ